jgi:N utilization substance protein B
LSAQRHAARERALTLLYEAEQRSVSVDDVLAELPLEPDEYAVTLAQAVTTDQPSLDELIGGTAKGWSIVRMPVIDRTVLRLALAELTTQPDVPIAVIIDEAVELAKEYSTADSARFVNGVLATLAPTLRP